jgi:hypothetical protein
MIGLLAVVRLGSAGRLDCPPHMGSHKSQFFDGMICSKIRDVQILKFGVGGEPLTPERSLNSELQGKRRHRLGPETSDFATQRTSQKPASSFNDLRAFQNKGFCHISTQVVHALLSPSQYIEPSVQD